MKFLLLLAIMLMFACETEYEKDKKKCQNYCYGMKKNYRTHVQTGLFKITCFCE